MARARECDSIAWDRLVDLYAPLVLYWCRRGSLRDEDSADVFQEVFQAVAAHLGGFRKERSGDTFRGWLRTITRNKIHDFYQKQRREPAGVGGTVTQQRLAAIPSPAVDEDADSDELGTGGQLVRRALEQIRPHFEERTWQAFWRTGVDEQPAGEVATELGMSPGAVRVAKSRVLQRLREELGELIE